MEEAVVTRESIRIKAKRDHARGAELKDCPFWETSEAAKTWREEWRRLETIHRANVYGDAKVPA